MEIQDYILNRIKDYQEYRMGLVRKWSDFNDPKKIDYQYEGIINELYKIIEFTQSNKQT
jgi:hypothetical protein